MQDWPTILKTLSDDELIRLGQLVKSELDGREASSRRWQYCPRCNGTGKLEGGYCNCAMGRDVRLVELGTASSYERHKDLSD